MKQSMNLAIASIALCTSAFGQQPQKEMENVKQTVIAVAAAADNNNADELAEHLDANFRIVMNRLFGSKEVAVMPRSVYLDKIRNKEFGGDKRSVTFKEVILNGNTAVVKVVLAGEKATFTSLLTLVRNESGDWLLVSDVPTVG